MLRALSRHWPEYGMEAAGLGVLMVALCSFATLLFHPDSPLLPVVDNAAVRRLLMGLAMGATALALVYSPWGKQSGAHFNPAVTLAFFRLQRVSGPDATWYVLAQGSGAMLGVGIMAALFGDWLSHPAIHYVATMPGPRGAALTWFAESVMSLLLMAIVLTASNSRRFARWTGVFASLLTVANVSVLVPLVGTSLNPARSLASAVPAHDWRDIWVYLTAAPVGMLMAAALYVQRHGAAAVFCAKLHHQNDRRCIFCQTRAERAAMASADSERNQFRAAASNRVMSPNSDLPSTDRQESFACPPSATTT
jgi:aquaporin Z